MADKAVFYISVSFIHTAWTNKISVLVILSKVFSIKWKCTQRNKHITLYSSIFLPWKNCSVQKPSNLKYKEMPFLSIFSSILFLHKIVVRSNLLYKYVVLCHPDCCTTSNFRIYQNNKIFGIFSDCFCNKMRMKQINLKC